MEKLQKALKKARMERSTLLPGGDNTSSQGPQHGPQIPAKGSGAAKGAKKAGKATGKPAEFPEIWKKLPSLDPNPELLLRNHVTTLNAQPSANPFDMLRTKIFLQMRENGWKRLAITSPTESCGKTTTACNLAVGFSRQRETKTMLFDMDLRRPAVSNILGRRPDHSIKDLLIRDVRPQEQILRLRQNVAISMARGPVNDPTTQVLLAQRTSEMLDELQALFDPDIMIFDLPPMLVTDDTRAFLKNIDCALIVARAEHTKMSQLDTCEREVSEHTNVLGVVLNNCRYISTEESAYYSD